MAGPKRKRPSAIERIARAQERQANALEDLAAAAYRAARALETRALIDGHSAFGNIRKWGAELADEKVRAHNEAAGKRAQDEALEALGCALALVIAEVKDEADALLEDDAAPTPDAKKSEGDDAVSG